MFKQESNYPSVRSLLTADAKAPLPDSTFDDELWLLLCKKIHKPSDVDGIPIEVAHYYASRLVQWEVGNGGFAKAAYSSPEWLARAASAYELLGKAQFAELIREAAALVPVSPGDLEKLEDQFEAITERLNGVEWEIDDTRIAYVRSHTNAFSAI